MATRFVLNGESGVGVGSAFPQRGRDAQGRMYLAFDAATDETHEWGQLVAPQGLTGTLTLVIQYYMASGTTGNVVLTGQVEAVTPADTLDLDSASSFDTVNSVTSAVPGTQGYLASASITLTNADSIAAGDYFRLRVARDADNASDTAAGDCHLLTVEFRDAA
jgi:hypothetical protein